MTLPPKALHVLADIKRELIQSSLPSVEDLDAVAEEQRVKERTARLEPKGSSVKMRTARSKGGSYQRFRSRELQRIARA